MNEKGVAKLADFGISGRLKNTVHLKKSLIGTPYYLGKSIIFNLFLKMYENKIAPEVVAENSRGYSTGIDIWSFGISIIEVMNF